MPLEQLALRLAVAGCRRRTPERIRVIDVRGRHAIHKNPENFTRQTAAGAVSAPGAARPGYASRSRTTEADQSGA